MNGTFIRLQGEFTDLTIPKLYRDKTITAGTKYCYDAKDTYSYVKQAAPVAGLDVWKNLLDGGPAAVFSGVLGFDAGFSLFTTANEYITLPTAGIAAANADAFVAIIWIKLGNPGETGGSAVLAAASGYTTANNQYSLTWNNKELRTHVGGWQATVVYPADVVATDIYQFAVSMKKRAADGKYDLKCYVNGKLRNSSISAFTEIPQPVGAQYLAPTIGNGPAYASVGWAGTVYRTLFDDCSVKTAEELVALDYAENRVRIAGTA